MPKYKHGHAKSMTRTYRAWSSMRSRGSGLVCPERYADRGITVCERWSDFENFLADMGEVPPGMTLDRSNNNGGYEPGNCRWVSMKVQANNRQSNRIIEHGGERLTVAQWAERAGLSQQTLHYRIKTGWAFGVALTTPVNYANRRKQCP